MGGSGQTGKISWLFRFLLLLVTAVCAQQHSDAGEKSEPVDSGAKAPVLQGNVKDEAQIKPSVKLLLAPGEKPAPHVEPKVDQFAGSQSYKPGQPAPKLPPPPVHKAGVVQNAPAEQKPPEKKAAPPSWLNYQLTPKNGVMSWSSKYAVKVVTPEPKHLPQKGSSDLHLTKFEEQMILRAVRNGTLQAVGTTPVSQSVRAAPLPQPIQLRAMPLTLPGLPPVFHASNWDEWYKHVASAVYERWSRVPVGPGSVSVRITVWRDHSVDSRIIEFTPVNDLERDAKAEVKFREAAIETVNKFNGDGLWEFPPMVNAPKNIVFDMDMSRSVGGPVGCEVVHTHLSGADKSSKP